MNSYNHFIGFKLSLSKTTALLVVYFLFLQMQGQVGNGSTAAYSTRKIVNTYNGPAIQVRRTCDNLTADIGFTACGDLDTNMLKAHVFGAPPVGAGSGSIMSYGLRKLICGYSGSAIRVRRSCDNAETNIGFTANGDLDTVALKNFVFGAGALNMISTSANVAYSLRRLRCAYTGSAIRVRRSSDNTTLDIGFTVSGDLDTAALKTFVGTGNGFVTIWYDQSGNAKNLSQATAGNQPQIISSGAVLRHNGKPTVRFTASATNVLRFSGTITSGSGAFSILAISSRTNATITAGSEMFGWGANSSNGSRIGLWNDINTGNNSLELLNRAKIGNSTTAGALDLKTWIYTSGNISTGLSGYYNGSVISTTLFGGLDITPNVVGTEICMGAVPTTTAHPFDGNISEVIGFTSSLSTTERQILEYLQSIYYNITGPSIVSIGSTSADAFVTTWYDQSGSARNAIQTLAANQPRIVNDGKIDRINSKPTILFDGVNDYFTHNSFPTSGFTGFTANMIVSWTTVGSSISTIQALMDNDHRCPSGPSSGLGFIVQDRPDFVNKPVTFAAPNSSSCNSLSDNANTGNGTFRLLSFVNNGSSETIYRDGSQTGTQTYSGSYMPQSRFVIGAWWNLGSVSRFMNGNMSEITIFPLGLNNSDRRLLEYNQAVYYGINGPTSVASTNSPSGYVATWYDQSGTGRNLSQTTLANQPAILNAGVITRHNGNPAVKFDGTNDYLIENTLPISNPSSFSIVASRSASGGFSGYQRILNLSATGDSYGYIGTLNGDIATFVGNGTTWNDITANSPANNLGTSNVANIISGTIATGVSGLNSFRNGAVLTAKNGTMASSTGFILGGAYSGGSGTNQIWNGSISDVVYFNSAINNTRRILIENDYSQYYGIAISNDKFTPTDLNFNKNLTGIGRESATDSVQRTRVSKGFIIEDDISSGSNFLRDNGDYIVAAEACSQVPDISTNNISQGVQRRWITDWEVKRTDIGNNGGRVRFIFDYGDYWGNSFTPLAAASQYVLLKRNTSSGVFDTLSVYSKQVVGDRVIFTLDAININTFFTIGTRNALIAPLPVTIASQNTVWNKDDAVVSWTTASESNNSHFVILRSTNGSNWEQVGSVNSKSTNGNSSLALSYKFIDKGTKTTLNGFVMYRIAIVSKNGESYRHHPMTLRNTLANNGIQIVPNPTAGNLEISGTDLPAEKATIQVLNSQGKVRRQHTVTLGNGNLNTSCNLAEYADGIYIVRVTCGEIVYTEKVVLMKGK